MIKLNIAAGPCIFPFNGWTNFDRDDNDGLFLRIKNGEFNGNDFFKKLSDYANNGGKLKSKVHDLRDGFPQYKDGSVDLIYVGQAIEHVNPFSEAPQFLQECHRMLKPGGLLRMATPDLDLLINAYLSGEMDKFAVEQPGIYTKLDPSAQLAMLMYGSSGATCVWDHYEGHMFLYTKTSISTILKFAGFTDITFYYEQNKSKSPIFAKEVTDFGMTHSFIVEAVKDKEKYNLIESTLDFKGNKYKIASIELGDHPSYHGFVTDEVVTRDQLWDIKSGDYVLDIGACYGSYTLTALASGAEKVYAWSPQSHGYLSEKIVLEESLKLNGWEDKCVVYNNGVYDKKGWLCCYDHAFFDHDPGPIKAPYSNTVSDVFETDTLDAWYESEFLPNENGNFNDKTIWMKMDVEASELEVVRGAQKLINELHPIIFLENHQCIIPDIDVKFKELMKDMFSYEEIITVPYYNRSHSIYKYKANK